MSSPVDATQFTVDSTKYKVRVLTVSKLINAMKLPKIDASIPPKPFDSIYTYYV